MIDLIDREEARLVKSGALAKEGNLHVAQEGFFEMLPQSYFRRFPRIRGFQAAFAHEASSQDKAKK